MELIQGDKARQFPVAMQVVFTQKGTTSQMVTRSTLIAEWALRRYDKFG